MGVSGSQQNDGNKPVVVVVGGGYGGTQCAKILDKNGQFFVVLIDRKSYFLHNVAALRATVEQDFSEQITIPYDRLLTNGCVVQAEVVSISHDGVHVHGRQEPIHFNYLVIATGSSYAFPGKIAEPNRAKAIDMYNNIQGKIKQSQEILIIGGGAVGVELASEITTDFPEKKVIIVHSQPTLLQPNIFNEKLYTRLHEQLEKLNVKVILNDRVELPSDPNNQNLNYIEGKRTYETKNSKTSITADLAFLCTGAHVNNRSLMNGSLKTKINPATGRLIVNNYLQVDGYENIFAIGDICDKQAKLAYLAGEQANYVGKLIPQLQNKKSNPKEYSAQTKPAILISLGRNGGVGQLPILFGPVVGDFLIKMFKSKDMFTLKYRSDMNYDSQTTPENKSPYLDKIDPMQSLLSLSEEDARKLLEGLPPKEVEPGQNFI